MKKTLALLLLSAIAILSACKKEHVNCCFIPENEFYIFSPTGDSTWHGRPETSTFKDSLSIIGRQTEASLIMNIKFKGKGTYLLTANSLYFSTLGGDVIVSRYIPETGSKIIVTEYDTAKKIIAGTFSVKMRRAYGYPASAYPDQISFLQGNFKVTLPK